MSTARHYPPAALLKLFDRWAARVAYVIGDRFGPEETTRIEAEARREFVSLIPSIPYIGSRWLNVFAIELWGAAMSLALYRVLLRRSLEPEAAGRILYEVYQAFYFAYPAWLRWLIAKGHFSSATYLVFRLAAWRSHRRRFPDDWVVDFIPGKKGEFDFGIDFSECALCKFYDKVGSRDFAQIHCAIDFPMSEAFESGLSRKTAISQGDRKCEFRYRKGRPADLGWPPVQFIQWRGNTPRGEQA